MDDRVSQLSQPIISLSRSDLAALMPFGAYVEAVSEAFRLHAQGRTLLPEPMHVVAENGGFHVKAGGLSSDDGYVAFKVNANFPNNRVANGLPTIQGAILLFNSKTGSPLALLDSIEITIKRTGAATAVAAGYLARPESRVATIVGCGEQGRIQLEAVRHALDLERVFLFDRDRQAAAALAGEVEGIEVEIASSLREATLASDVIVTCTPAKTPLLGLDDVRPGTFIAAIGADNPEKKEIAPALMARASVITDVTAQAAHMGDLNHAIRAGTMREADVHAEIGEIIDGRKTGRANSSEITIFAGSASAYRTSPPRCAPTRLRSNVAWARALVWDDFASSVVEGMGIKAMSQKAKEASMRPPILIISAALALVAVPAAAQPIDWSKVDAAFGRKAAVSGDAHRYGFPRTDLSVTLEGVQIKPGFALGGWVVLKPAHGGAMVMGDLVLLEAEINPVMTALIHNGLEITAVHNHLLRANPATFYMHVGGHGDPEKIATAIVQALQSSKTPLAPPTPPATQPAIDLDTSQLDQIIGVKGQANGGVYQFGVPRRDVVKEGGMDLTPAGPMGVATGINFQTTDGGKAAITGDFVLIADEVNPVIKELRATGIEVTAIHSHMLDEQPRLIFMHFWANDDAIKLAKGLRAALDKTASTKS